MRNQLMAEYLRDPKVSLFEDMLKEGTSTAPVQSWTQGLARMVQGGLGGYMAKKLRDEYEGKSEKATGERTNALNLAIGKPEETQTYGDTTINWNAQAPNFQAASSALQSPYNEDLQNTLFSTKMGQDQTAQNQEFLRQQQAQQFAQQRQLAEMTARRQEAAQKAMLDRQMQMELWKQQNDPIAKILGGGNFGQPNQPMPQAATPNMTPTQHIQQGQAPTLGQVGIQPQEPQGIDPQAALFNSALAAQGLKAPDGYMYTRNPQGGLGLVQMPQNTQRKLSATEQKELFDAMDLIQAGESAGSSLAEASKVLKKQNPYTGFGAETIAAANRIPVIGGLVDDDRATATTNISNAVTEQALNQLKALFGGMPTEGERQVLLSLQALPSYSKQEQEMILDRAQKAVGRRLEYNRQKAQGIQTGGYKTMQVPSYQDENKSTSGFKLLGVE